MGHFMHIFGDDGLVRSDAAAVNRRVLDLSLAYVEMVEKIMREEGAV